MNTDHDFYNSLTYVLAILAAIIIVGAASWFS